MSEHHEHEHEHHEHDEHDEDCPCCHDGHNHEHGHEGHEHHHEHHHHHDGECCDHDHEHEDHEHALSHEAAVARGAFAKSVDGAIVGSVSLDISCQESDENMQARIAQALTQVSTAIEGQGGIVGHAKASLERRTISKVSVIDGRTTVDINEAVVYAIDVAIISFLVEESFVVEQLQTAFAM